MSIIALIYLGMTLMQLYRDHSNDTQIYRTIPYNTVQYRAILPYHFVQYRTIPYNTVQYRAILPYHFVQYRTIPYNTVQYRIIPYIYIHQYTTTQKRSRELANIVLTIGQRHALSNGRHATTACQYITLIHAFATHSTVRSYNNTEIVQDTRSRQHPCCKVPVQHNYHWGGGSECTC